METVARKRVIVMQRDLSRYGITYSRMQIHRLINDGILPKPFKIGNKNAWWEDEILDFIDGCADKRDHVDTETLSNAREAQAKAVEARRLTRDDFERAIATDDTLQQWDNVLTMIVENVRANRPDDPRSDEKIMTDFLDRIVELRGIAKRDGKYRLNKIVKNAEPQIVGE